MKSNQLVSLIEATNHGGYQLQQEVINSGLKKAINTATKEILADLANYNKRTSGIIPTLADINGGQCTEWAWRVNELFPNAEVVYDDDAGHTMISYNGMIFDAEAPHGVKERADLPFYKRL